MDLLNKVYTSLRGVTSYLDLLVYAAIAILFILGFIKCILPVIHTRNVLSRAVSHIKNGKKGAWQEDDFLGRGALYSHWSEYLNNLFFAEGNYHNPSNVEDFINEETVIYGPGSSGFADALPGLMVSLGFMGTLLGLARGLSGFDMGDENAIMTSIETLIPGMRYAFLTSIVGVIGSVVFTILLRLVDGSAMRTLNRFYGAMSRHAGVQSVDPMTQIAIYQQEQTAMIKSLADNISQELSVTMSDAMKPVESALTNFVNVNTSEQMRFLDTVVSRFVQRMDSALNGKFNDLSSVLTRTVQTQDRLIASVETQLGAISHTAELSGKLERSLENTVSGVDSFVAKLLLSQRQLDDAYDKLAQGVQAINTNTEKQSAMMKDIERASQTMGDVMQRMALMTAELRAAAEAVKDATNAVGTLKDSAKTGAKEVSDALAEAQSGALRQAENELSDMLETMRRYQREYSARTDEALALLSQTIEKLPKRIDDVTKATAEQIDRMNAALNRAQRSLNDAVDEIERMR